MGKLCRPAALALATLAAVLPSVGHAGELEIAVAPFVWASTLKGQLSEGPVTIPLQASPAELAGGVKSGGMLHAEAMAERFQVSAQVIHSRFSDRSFAPIMGADVRSNLWTIEATAGPRLRHGGVEFVPMAGLRHTRIKGTFTAAGLGTLRAGKRWEEGLLGLEDKAPLTERLTVRARGAVAVAGPAGQSSSDLILAGSYRLGKSVSLAAGYRWAHERVLPDKASSFGMDLDAEGPLVGLVIGL